MEIILKNKMKAIISLIMLICIVQQIQAQNSSGYRIVSSNLGSSGSSQSVETSRGIYKISQSVGQSSVIGTYYNNGYYLRQGYQQPTNTIKTIKNSDIELRAKVYPNPFSQTLFVTFSDLILKDITVKIFNVEARLIYAQEFLPSQRLELQLQDISSGSYFLSVASGRKKFKTKMIKI